MARPIKKQVWNNVDGFGLLNGIATWDKNFLNLKYVRLPDESNIDVRHKINRVRNNQTGGTTEQDLVNGLSNELLINNYSMASKKTFILTRTPQPSGLLFEQDIHVYQQSSGIWGEVLPQMWGKDVEDGIPSSGFIVWEDTYYRPRASGIKSNEYSQLLHVYDSLSDETRLKIVYSVKDYDQDNNLTYRLFTDMSNVEDEDDDRFIYRTPDIIPTGVLTNTVVAYKLDDMPILFSGVYYNDDGSATGKLYRIRDIIDESYRHKWMNVRDKQTIWDIHKDSSDGTIPSFYDTPVYCENLSGFVPNLLGGVEYKESALYIQDISLSLEGDIEHWYPVFKPGKFYVDGQGKYLMENPYAVTLDLTTGSTSIPSGVQRHHFNTLYVNGISGQYSGSGVLEHIYDVYTHTHTHIQNDGAYSGVFDINNNVCRRVSYLTADMGYETSIASGEYMIDYDNNIIYASGMGYTTLYWDNVDLPTEVIVSGVFTDLNPINDSNIPYDDYFLIIGEE